MCAYANVPVKGKTSTKGMTATRPFRPMFCFVAITRRQSFNCPNNTNTTPSTDQRSSDRPIWWSICSPNDDIKHAKYLSSAQLGNSPAGVNSYMVQPGFRMILFPAHVQPCMTDSTRSFPNGNNVSTRRSTFTVVHISSFVRRMAA